VGQREDVAAILQAADVLVHPSINDPFPLAVLEALASGTPVVATDVGGVSAMLEGGAAGLLVPPEDVDAFVEAVYRMTDDADLRAQLVEHGLSIARTMTADSQARRIASFIKDG
jgi:glycosyltransferase involved in cell wall biosynthesis